jgi:large subunit ribosomal protein L18
MYHVKARSNKREKRKLRVRSKVYGTKDKPRFSVFRSLKHIYAQLIDDRAGKTLVYAQSNGEKGTKSEQAFELGKELAKAAVEKKIKEVVFDRNGYRYHGRVKSLADGAREGGLKF